MNHHMNFTYKNYNSDFAIERMLGAKLPTLWSY